MKKKRYSDEFKKLGITKTELKNSNNIEQYRINGRIYSFHIPNSELYNETLYAYCFALNKWAWLYPDFVYLKDSSMIIAEKIN